MRLCFRRESLLSSFYLFTLLSLASSGLRALDTDLVEGADEEESNHIYTTPKARVEAAFATLQQWYDVPSGLWNTTGWWNAANCLTTIANLATIQPTLTPSLDSQVFDNTFTQAQIHQLQVCKTIDNGMAVSSSRQCPVPRHSLQAPLVAHPHGFLNDYYDDEGWWALAWIRVYDVTQKPKYLSAAADIFEDMTRGWSTPCGGGVWWDKRQTYISAISNELFLSVAAHLANRAVGTARREYYRAWAMRQWRWFAASGMINAEGVVNDGLDRTTCTNNGEVVWSYNQGVVLGALVEMFGFEGDRGFLRTAEDIAAAAVERLTGDDGVLRDVCEPDCGADGSQFKGVFVRNVQILLGMMGASDGRLDAFVERNAESIWENDRNDRNELSLVWAGPFVVPANASTQCSALDALVADMGKKRT